MLYLENTKKYIVLIFLFDVNPNAMMMIFSSLFIVI